MKKLGALAEAVATNLNVKDPESVRKVNAELRKIRADLKRFAKVHKLTLIGREVSPRKSGASS